MSSPISTTLLLYPFNSPYVYNFHVQLLPLALVVVVVVVVVVVDDVHMVVSLPHVIMLVVD